MKRIILTLGLIACFLSPASASDQWIKVADRVGKSIVKFTMTINDPDEGTFKSACTGEVVDNQRDYILTAAHCIGEDQLADGMQANLVWSDRNDDLAIYQVKGIDKPELRPSAKAIKPGMEIATLGYAYGGHPGPYFRHGYVANIDAHIDEAPFFGPNIAVDTPYIGGMSGGPVVDENANLVGIVQFGDGKSGYGRSIGYILSKVGKYFKR